MKNKVLTAASAIVILSVMLCFFSGCNDKKDEDNSLTVTDPEGVTYLAIENQDGEVMAGVTDAQGNLYAAEIDDDGNVLSDGKLYLVESYTGTLPHNDTTAVSINQSPQTTHNFAQGDVIIDPDASTAVVYLDDESDDKNSEKVTGSNDNTTSSGSKGDSQKTELMAEKYKKLFASGSYYIEFTAEEENMREPITAAVKNGNIYMRTKLEGMNCNMIYQKEKDAVYVVMTDFRVYCKMPSDMMSELEMTSFGQTEKVKNATVYNAVIDGRDCICESYETESGDVSIYYFYEGDLVRMDQIGADGTVGIMNIIKVSSSVDDSLFELPKAYVPINLSNIPMDTETETKSE